MWKRNDYNFCGFCGAENMLKNPHKTYFDEKTGEKIIYVYLICPNWRWWNTRHFKEEFIGEDMVVERY